MTKPREKTREELQAEKSSLCSVFCAFVFNCFFVLPMERKSYEKVLL